MGVGVVVAEGLAVGVVVIVLVWVGKAVGVTVGELAVIGVVGSAVGCTGALHAASKLSKRIPNKQIAHK